MAGKKFASNKNAIAECDRCSFRYPLKVLKKETRKGHIYNIRVCPQCWDVDHPQWFLGEYPVYEAIAIQEPRPDISYFASGPNALGNAGEGSRIFEWGWYPVGGAANNAIGLTPNSLATRTYVGQVMVQIT